MLSRSTRSRAVSVQQLARRHFDYLAVANRVDKGESVDAQIQSAQAASEKDASRFTWGFMQWYEKYGLESLPGLNSVRAKFQQYEQFVGGQRASSGTNIDFGSYRERIADPRFVDELEIEYNVNVATTQSIANMGTLEKWSTDSVNGFKKECESHGDLLWAPLTKANRAEFQQSVEEAEANKVKTTEYMTELQKDYEQVDAERMIYGQETTQMRYSEHPQYAETIEDQMAAYQTFGDYLMMPWENNQMKHERLAGMQDENRRKLFLERFEKGSKVYNGLDAYQRPGGGH